MAVAAFARSARLADRRFPVADWLAQPSAPLLVLVGLGRRWPARRRHSPCSSYSEAPIWACWLRYASEVALAVYAVKFVLMISTARRRCCSSRVHDATSLLLRVLLPA
jgi:hypothetical protein